jgi:hypothetical protein
MVKKLLNFLFGHILVKRVTVKEPPAGALLASKKKKVKPVTKVQKVKKAPNQRSTHGVSMGESPSHYSYLKQATFKQQLYHTLKKVFFFSFGFRSSKC